ncbi:MAG: penicillin-binding protein, partial [Actinomycetota bacterium]|nr:penicillin-binding protein [Actinomycetota bacterium]
MSQQQGTGAGSSRTARRPLWRRVLGWLGVAMLAGAILVLGGFLVAYTLVDIPDPNEDFQAESSFVYYADGKTELGSFAVQNRQLVSLDEVPAHMQQAVIAAEDRTFYENAGIDLKGIARAAYNNIRGEATQGASTITQQYVKILYLTQDQTYTRKAREGILALKVQREVSKGEILQGYLNTIYFGRGAYGVQAASLAYFDADVADISARQSALLATVLNSPGTLDPRQGKAEEAAALVRYRYVLDGMAQAGDVEQAEAKRLARRLPRTIKATETDKLGGPEGFLLAMAREELRNNGFTEADLDAGGLQVTTTFSREAMDAATEAARAQELGDLKQLHVALASVEPGTGKVRAVYGGDDYVKSDFNWALAGGQPGSSFKPFALLAALRGGISLRDTFDGNSPYVLEATGEDVENQGDSGGGSFGTVSLLTATIESINTAYVDLTLSMENGGRKVIRAAEAAGIPRSATDKLSPVPVVPLGYAPVPTIDMANAYATFAANGRRTDWHVVEKVVNADGDTVYKPKNSTQRTFSAKVASDVSYALQEVVEVGTGTNASTVRCPVAGKTGTATGEKGEVTSSWFVGYTPTLSTAVMYVRGDGNDELEGFLPTFYGGEFPARTFASYMQEALPDTPCVEFPEPAFLTATTSPPTSSTSATTSAPSTTPPLSTTQPPTTTESATTKPTTTTTTTTTTTKPGTATGAVGASSAESERCCDATDQRFPAGSSVVPLRA